MKIKDYVNLSDEDKTKLTLKELNALILELAPDYKHYIRKKDKAIMILHTLTSLDDRHRAFERILPS